MMKIDRGAVKVCHMRETDVGAKAVWIIRVIDRVKKLLRGPNWQS